MKTKKEIEKLADDYSDIGKEAGLTFKEHTLENIAYKKGYTQCQEDMINELKEWIEITLSAKSKLGASDNVIEELLNVKYKIESLNKQG
jgi:hypothetical protein